MQASKIPFLVLKPASRSWNKRFDEEKQKVLDYTNLDSHVNIRKASGSICLHSSIIDRSKRLIGLGQNAYMDKILKIYRMDNSKRGHIPMQERLDLNKTQGASTPKEVKRMQKMYLMLRLWVPLSELQVDCYCDAGFETDRDDTKSQTGYVFILNGGTVDWKSSKQSTTAMFATKAEYIAALEAAMEAVWISKFNSGLVKVPTINKPIRKFCR
ncbi:hypothetical protein Tco_0765340 [Tanacetum coccineum]